MFIINFKIFLQEKNNSTAPKDVLSLNNNKKKKLANRKAVKKYRNKMSANAEFKQKESKRVEECRKKRVTSMSEEQKIEYRRKAAERKRKSRASNKNRSASSSTSHSGNSTITNSCTPTTTPQHPYKRPQSFGKAITTSMSSLPSSPNKRRCVVQGLAKVLHWMKRRTKL